MVGPDSVNCGVRLHTQISSCEAMRVASRNRTGSPRALNRGGDALGLGRVHGGDGQAAAGARLDGG